MFCPVTVRSKVVAMSAVNIFDEEEEDRRGGMHGFENDHNDEKSDSKRSDESINKHGYTSDDGFVVNDVEEEEEEEYGDENYNADDDEYEYSSEQDSGSDFVSEEESPAKPHVTKTQCQSPQFESDIESPQSQNTTETKTRSDIKLQSKSDSESGSESDARLDDDYFQDDAFGWNNPTPARNPTLTLEPRASEFSNPTPQPKSFRQNSNYPSENMGNENSKMNKKKNKVKGRRLGAGSARKYSDENEPPVCSPCNSPGVVMPDMSMGRKGILPHKEVSWRVFKQKRNDFSRELFNIFNKGVFDSKLPADMSIEWNARLKTTAGLTTLKLTRTQERLASIQLSTKVLTDYEKLKQTLCHELCHAATWLLDGVLKPPHGRAFKCWGYRCRAAFPGINVSR